MEAVSRYEHSFINTLKRIWDGPNYEEMEGLPNMEFGKSKKLNSNSNNNIAEYKIEVKADEPIVNTSTEQSRPNLQPLKPDFQAQKPFELASNDYNTPQQMTIITKGTVLTGDLKSSGNLEIYGTVTGNINTTGNIKINGKQVGDIQGANISFSSCTVRGNVTATEDVNIDSDSVILGDIKAKNLTINGRLQGNIFAKAGVVCQSNAIVVGDLTAATVAMNNGAKLKGKMQISNGQIDDIKIPSEDQSVPVIES